jgi:hyperosmotically inducible periplasmic protein
MKHSPILSAAALAIMVFCASGVVIARDPQSPSHYSDDSAITAAVKTHLAQNPAVDGAAITVDTMQGIVMLAGVTRSASEKAAVESIARQVPGVVAVKSIIDVRP